MMNEYEIRIDKFVPHPDGTDHRSTQLLLNVKLSDRAIAKVIAAIANELNYIAEMSDD